MRFKGENTNAANYHIRAQTPGDAPSYSVPPGTVAAPATFDIFVDDAQADEIRTQLGNLTGVTFREEDAFAQAQLVDLAAPDAAGSTDIHATYAGNAAPAFPGAFTNPDVPRAVRCVFAASYDGGDITITGTDQFDQPQTDTILAAAASTVEGVAVFKTVTAAVRSTTGSDPATVSIGHGLDIGIPRDIADANGMLFADGVAEAGTYDATENTVRTATAPNGAVVFSALVNV